MVAAGISSAAAASLQAGIAWSTMATEAKLLAAAIRLLAGFNRWGWRDRLGGVVLNP
jgi:hypothetical protein